MVPVIRGYTVGRARELLRLCCHNECRLIFKVTPMSPAHIQPKCDKGCDQDNSYWNNHGRNNGTKVGR